jgi:hypothetical protein
MRTLPGTPAKVAQTLEISRSEMLRDNERIKHFAGAVTAWSNALVIKKLWEDDRRFEPGPWACCGDFLWSCGRVDVFDDVHYAGRRR